MPTWNIKKYKKLAKGFYGRAKNCIRQMSHKVERAQVFKYQIRRLRRRQFRRVWITQISAAVREHNVNYSNFMYGYTRSNIELDRKILSDLAINEPYSFKAIVDEIKINQKVKLIPKEKMDYMEALSRGFIIEGHKIVKRPEPEFKAPKMEFSLE